MKESVLVFVGLLVLASAIWWVAVKNPINPIPIDNTPHEFKQECGWEGSRNPDGVPIGRQWVCREYPVVHIPFKQN